MTPLSSTTARPFRERAQLDCNSGAFRRSGDGLVTQAGPGAVGAWGKDEGHQRDVR
jgi:hypothetical protein